LATYGFIWRRFDDLLMFHCWIKERFHKWVDF
jgi:hypothetical protein